LQVAEDDNQSPGSQEKQDAEQKPNPVHIVFLQSEKLAFWN
jgi:hypothetical protein